MQTRLLCMCSFLEAKAWFLNTTSQATTKESSTSNTSILSSPSQQDKNSSRPTLKPQTALIRYSVWERGLISFLNYKPALLSASQRWGKAINWIKISAFLGGNNESSLHCKQVLQKISSEITHSTTLLPRWQEQSVFPLDRVWWRHQFFLLLGPTSRSWLNWTDPKKIKNDRIWYITPTQLKPKFPSEHNSHSIKAESPLAFWR